MEKFTKFSEWEKSKYSSVEEDSLNNSTGGESDETSKLLAEIADLEAKRKNYVKYKEDFKAQMLEIEIKMKRLDVEKNNLKEKLRHLEGAEKIANEKRKEGKTNG